MTHHPHVHMIVPGGGISPDGERWIAAKPNFFLPVLVLSKLHRVAISNSRLIAADADGVHLQGQGLPDRGARTLHHHDARARCASCAGITANPDFCCAPSQPSSVVLARALIQRRACSG